MKIAIFTDTYPPQINGVANVAHQSATELVKFGHEVIVFTVSVGRGQNVETETNGFTVVRVPSMPTHVYDSQRLALPVGFWSKVEKFAPDIIHSHTPFMMGWCAVWVSRSLNVPLIGTHHTFFDQYLKHIKLNFEWTKKASWRYTVGYYDRCDIIISPSKALADELKEFGAKKSIVVLHNPVNTHAFHPASETVKPKLKKKFAINGINLVYMGRVSYEKSLDQVLLAMQAALRKTPELQLMIVGDGPERPALEKMAAELGISKSLIFTSYLRGRKLLEALQASDIFITASLTENMPLSVLEAEATGLPVIAVKALGMPEIVKHNVNGLLATAGNYHQLARFIVELADNEQRLIQLGNGSLEIAKAHSPRAITAQLVAIYKQAKMRNEN